MLTEVFRIFKVNVLSYPNREIERPKELKIRWNAVQPDSVLGNPQVTLSENLSNLRNYKQPSVPYLEPSRTSTIEFLTEIVYSCYFRVKSSIVDLRLGSKYAFELAFCGILMHSIRVQIIVLSKAYLGPCQTSKISILKCLSSDITDVKFTEATNYHFTKSK